MFMINFFRSPYKKSIMQKRLFISALLAITTLIVTAQTDPNNIPRPPVEKLKIFEPYFGKYEHTMDYAGLKWKGTMEVKPIIKDWYVDWTIWTKSEDKRIDREYHMLVTWDSTQNRYRVWRFETLPHGETEPTLRTEGTDIILEMKMTRKDGNEFIFYNRYSLVGKNEVKMVTEIRSPEGQKIRDIGVTIAKKVE